MAKVNQAHRDFFAANPETPGVSADLRRQHAANPEWFGTDGGSCAVCAYDPNPRSAPRPAAPYTGDATGRSVGRPVTAPEHERLDREVYDAHERPYLKGRGR